MTSITSWRTDHEAQRLDSQNIIHWSPVKWLVPSAREQLQFVVEVNDSTMDVCNFHEFSACAIVWQPFQIHTKHQSHILGVYPLHRLYIDLKYTVGTSNLGSWHGHLGVADEITGLFFLFGNLIKHIEHLELWGTHLQYPGDCSMFGISISYPIACFQPLSNSKTIPADLLQDRF